MNDLVSAWSDLALHAAVDLDRLARWRTARRRRGGRRRGDLALRVAEAAAFDHACMPSMVVSGETMATRMPSAAGRSDEAQALLHRAAELAANTAERTHLLRRVSALA